MATTNETLNTSMGILNGKGIKSYSVSDSIIQNAAAAMEQEGVTADEALSAAGLDTKATQELLIKETDKATATVTGETKVTVDTTPLTTEQKQNPIMDFARLVIGTKFQSKLKDILCHPGFSTLYQILVSFLRNFYYNIYTIPNLPNNKCMVIKPETLFVRIPKCNIILPCMKSQIYYSRTPKNEPTRVFLVTNPLQVLNQDVGSKLATVSAINAGSNPWKSGDITCLAASTEVEKQKSKTWPVYNLTNYEKRFGPRLAQDVGGGDLLAFIEAGSIKEDNSVKKDAASNILKQLAKYKLLQSRYLTRTGSISLYFNPYIVPGFPMASLEEQSKDSVAFNVYGYVTTVVHSITDSNWTTTVNFAAATTDGEIRPDVFPIAENDFTPGNIRETYGNMLGVSDCYTAENISSAFVDLTKDNVTLTKAYEAVKRPATTVEDHFKQCGRDLTIEQVGNVMCLRSNGFFNKSIQDAILEYSSSILDNDKHYAMTTADVR